MYKKYFKTIGLAIIIPIVFLYAFQQGASLAYNYWLSMWADDPVVNGTQIDTDLKLTVFGALGFVQGPFDKNLVDKHCKCTVHIGLLVLEIGWIKYLSFLFRYCYLWYNCCHLYLRHHRLSPIAHGPADECASLSNVFL